ncbi:hypothetical protein FRB90_002830 [Tulasnella sp. 427]|nr:hypothetical protein FRB90_002830 [Tulasnella sp. 427]
MEESATRTVYEDYKFVERGELTRLGLDHLVGTKACKPYMHGFFISLRLYDAARLISNPFAYEEHREQLVKEKVEKLVESRIRTSKNGLASLPQVNRSLAEKLQRDWEKRTSVLKRKREKEKENGSAVATEAEPQEPTNPLLDPRFKEMFENPEFEVDVESREYGMLNPGGAAVASEKSKKRRKTAVELEAEESAASSSSDGLGRRRSSSSSSASSSSEDNDSEADNQLIDMARYKRLKESGVKFKSGVNESPADEPIVQSKEKEKAMLEAYPHFKKFIRQQDQASTKTRKLVTATAGLSGAKRDGTFGERVEEDGTRERKGEAGEEDEEDVEFEGVNGFEMTWTPAPTAKKDGDKKKKKGSKSFAAGLETGGGPEEEEGVTEEAQSQGRTKKRHSGQLRSAGKNTFRKLSTGR